MNFCFISSDAEIPAYEKFKLLTKNKIWPIFRRTNHRPKLKPNSNIIFYIAGTNIFSQNFVGSAKIDKIKIIEDSTAIEESDTINKISKTILKNKELHMIITLKEVLDFKNKVSIKNIMHELNFIAKKSHYGIYFQSGVNVMDENDYQTIIRSSNYWSA